MCGEDAKRVGQSAAFVSAQIKGSSHMLFAVNVHRRRLPACLIAVASLLMGSTSALAQAKPDLVKPITVPKKTEKPGTPPKNVERDVVVAPGGLEQIVLINETLANAWKENSITPAERCSDYEFIRRASLDIIGRIAKVHEIQKFMSDPPRQRRSMLIERLLASPEYANNLANTWTVLLLTRSGSTKMAQDQMRGWLEARFAKDDSNWKEMARDIITASGATDQNGAVNYVLHHMGETVKSEAGAFDMVPVTSRTTKLFLALQTQCTQCHDHPFASEKWLQQHFWGINAFFRQVRAPGGTPAAAGKKNKDAGGVNYTIEDDPSLNSRGIVSFERRSGVLLYTDATFVDGTKMSVKQGSTRRQELADFIVKSPYFAKAFVNRMWGHFFGRGFTRDSVADFGDHNPVTHQELLDRLAEDWATKYQHDPRYIVRWICNSDAYQLGSVANDTNDSVDDEAFFSRMLLKAMTPEQLFDSVMVATDSKVGQSKEARIEAKQQFLDKLIANFGDDEGNEQTFNGTVIQALMLMNGQDINEAIMDKQNGTVAAVLKKGYYSRPQATSAVSELYIAALNRPPTEGELKRILDPRTYLLPRVSTSARPTPAQVEEFWTGFYQDLFWAILNSNEFYLNH